MTNPFKYGELVTGEYFFNRKREKIELHQSIKSAMNVFLYAPRRYGKTSLVLEVLREVRQKKDICIYLDLLKAPTKQKFLELYAREIAKSVTTKFDEAINFCKKTFSRFIPKITLKAGNIPEIEFEISWTRQTEDIASEEIIELPQKIAKQRKRRAVVVFDEFPEISNYDGKKFEGELRSFIQKHPDVCYIFTGSKRRLLLKMIGDPTRPFYKSGKIVPLGKILQSEFETFIYDRFKFGNIEVNKENIKFIFDITKNHPYYTQMLCWELWERCFSKKQALKEDIQQTLEVVLDHQGEYFVTLWNSFSSRQKMLLLALAQESSANIFSKEFIKKFNLGAVSSIQKSLKRLTELEMVDKINGRHEISDIFFSLWIKERML
jgi:hypothetical protein